MSGVALRPRPQTDVTEPPGGRNSTAQNQAFAASLRTDQKNDDVFISGVPSPRLHGSLKDELAAWEASDLMASRNHHSLQDRPPSPPRREWGAPLPVPRPKRAKSPRSRQRGNKGRSHSSGRAHKSRDRKGEVSTSTELVPFLEKGGVDSRSEQLVNRRYQPRGLPSHVSINRNKEREGERLSSRASLLERRRQLRAATEETYAREARMNDTSESGDPPLTMDALAPPQQQLGMEMTAPEGQHRVVDDDRGYDLERYDDRSDKRAFVDDASFASETISSLAHKEFRGNRQNRHRSKSRTSTQHRSQRKMENNKSFSTGTSNAREQTRIFRMSGMSPRELIIENLRLQDRMTELQDRAHDALVGRSDAEVPHFLRGGSSHSTSNSLVVGTSNLRAERSVNILASTNADLSRRVQNAVLGEADAMSRLAKLEEENKQQQQRFAELVQMSRSEEKAREAAEKRAEEANAKLKEAEDRIVRLLSRLHMETKKNAHLKERAEKAERKLSNTDAETLAGDAALARAYENTQGEVQELRNQIQVLRMRNQELSMLSTA